MLALGSKTSTVTLPAALLVILWWQRGTISLRRDVAPLIPFFALATAMAILVKRPLWERLMIVATAPLIAVGANVARITLTGFLYEAGQRAYHSICLAMA